MEIPSRLTLPGPAEMSFAFVTHPVTSPTAVQITVRLVDPDTAAPLGTTSTTLTVTP